MAENQQVGVKVVRWTKPELPACLDALVAEAVGFGHAWASDLHETWQSRPFTGEGEALFLASQADGLLAMAAISADPFVNNAETGRLRFIYVRQTARRRGIADQLVAACLARSEGRWRRLHLHTDNSAAARLYERYGFQPSGSEPRATHVLDPILSHSLRQGVWKDMLPGDNRRETSIGWHK